MEVEMTRVIFDFWFSHFRVRKKQTKKLLWLSAPLSLHVSINVRNVGPTIRHPSLTVIAIWNLASPPSFFSLLSSLCRCHFLSQFSPTFTSLHSLVKYYREQTNQTFYTLPGHPEIRPFNPMTKPPFREDDWVWNFRDKLDWNWVRVLNIWVWL